VVRGAHFVFAVGLTAALSLGAAPGPPAPSTPPAPSPGQAALAVDPCPAGTLPDGNACVHLPGDDPDAPDTESEIGAHHDRRGRWVVYDQIPRRPERPADYDLYRYPVACERACVVSGSDLDQPDERQRRGRRLSHVGHGAVDLPGRKGAPVTLVALEHQEGDAEVIFVGPLFGTTLVTRHTLREGGRPRDYLLIFGHLDAVAAGLHAGAPLAAGAVVGYAGDTGSPELVHLHLEARRVREGVDPTRLSPETLVDNANTVVCDPRNVLPLR
jgi:hypothetical protein